MYRLYLVCCMSAVVFGNDEEAKYIDLLPETEKQEFLNRIARRIIEEIQSKDSPEQSQAEVSDDQLNAHHAYVQDLIKEESASLQNKRRNYNINENVQREADNDKLENDNVAQHHNNGGIEENSQHIDLTLRNERHREETKRKSEDSTFSVIPVKVIYDQDNTNSTQSSTNYPEPYSDSQHKISDSHLNDSKNEFVNTPSFFANYSKEKESVDQTEIQSTPNNYQVPEDVSENTSKNDIHIFTNNGQNVSQNMVEKSTEMQFNTSTTLVTGLNKESKYYDDSFENIVSSTTEYSTSNKNTEIKHNYLNKSDFSYINRTLLPLTKGTQSSSEDSKYADSPSSIIYVTTVKSTEKYQNIKTEEVVDIPHNAKELDEIKMKKDIKSTTGQRHLRKRLEILSEEYKFEKEGSHEKYNEPKQYRNKNIKQYFVYEIPRDKPVFFKMENSKEAEQPYVIPIYNFAPKNAYYNAYNHFGVNNNEEDEVNEKKSLGQEFYLRSGFEIDLNHNNDKSRNDKERPYKYFTKHPRHTHWEHLLNAKFENNPSFIEYQDDENWRRKIKRDNNFKQINNDKDTLSKPPKISSKIKYIPLRRRPPPIQSKIKYIPLRKRPPKIPSKIKYIPLRKQSEGYYDDEETNWIKEKKLDAIQKLQHSNDKNHAGEVKTFLHQQEKFRYQRPSRYEPKAKQGPERMLDRHYDFEISKENNNMKTKDIELDYYFGEYKINNGTGEFDSDEEYPEIEDPDVEHELFHDFTKKLNPKHYRMDIDDDCKHGCIEMGLELPEDNFDTYLDTLVKVLKDMIYRDNIGLVNYDWLLSTVDLESALRKLLDLTDIIEEGNQIHPLDLELLSYIVKLYNTSSHELENTRQSYQSKAYQDINDIVKFFLKLLRRRIVLPKNKRRKPGDRIKSPINFWYKYFVRTGFSDDEFIDAKVLRSFKMFLNDLEDNLFELHNALKHIGLIIKYSNQNWYKDLKNIYLKSASNKQLVQVILHLAASRLFSSIEDTAKSAEEDNLYINNNETLVRRIQKEFLFVLRILERAKKLN